MIGPSSSCVRRDTCRLCGGGDFSLVLSLTPTPPANAFVAEDALDAEQACFPLDVFFCNDCAHVQLRDVVDPRVLFEHYVYVSGTSDVFVQHFDAYAETVTGMLAGDAPLVVDVGSNDGTLLARFKERGCTVLGVDPAREIAKRASEEGIETIADFFSPALAERIADERGKAKAVTANNVFAHIDGMTDVVDGVRLLLADDGVFVFEVSYLVDVYEKTLFDTIYHEHLAYHTVAPLERFFADNGMELIGAERVETHGGSLRGYAQKAGGPRPRGAAVDALIERERSLGLDKPETFTAFADKLARLRAELHAALGEIKAAGKRVAGYGAPAKATTLMYHFGLGPETIDFIVDDNALKQGLFSPGLHIPIVAAEALAESRPDHLLVLAWNFARPIMAKNKAFHDAGGRFIVPLPTLEII